MTSAWWPSSTLPPLLGYFVVGGCIVLSGGCQRHTPTSHDEPTANQSEENNTEEKPLPHTAMVAARELLAKTLLHYQQQDNFDETLTLELQAATDSDPGHRITIKTRYQRPQRLQLEVLNGEAALRIFADQGTMYGQITDPAQPGLSQQVVVREKISRLTLEEIYACADYQDQADPNHLFSFFLDLPWDLQHTPWAWCLIEQHQLSSVVETFQPLAPADWQGRSCHRFQWGDSPRWIYWIATPHGTEVAGTIVRIDQQGPPSPGATMSAPDSQASPSQSSLRLMVEGASEPDRSAWLPLPTQIVPRQRYFVLEPPPLPTLQLGQPVAELRLASLASPDTPCEFPRGKSHVLVWFRNHPTSQAFLQQLQAEIGSLGDDAGPLAGTTWTAVCAEPPEALSDDACRALVQQWQISLPVARDTAALGRDLFQIQEAPTWIVLDPEGRLAWLEVGLLADSLGRMRQIVQRTAAGNDVGGEWQLQHQRAMTDFGQRLQQAALP